MKKNDGGPAFPVVNDTVVGVVVERNESPEGMKLRDYFAAMCLPLSWEAWDKGYFETDDPNKERAKMRLPACRRDDRGKGGGMNRLMILNEIEKERDRQDITWGDDRRLRPDFWNTILMEEVGEVSRAILEGDIEGYQKELIQVAAVAVAMLEDDKRNHASGDCVNCCRGNGYLEVIHGTEPGKQIQPDGEPAVLHAVLDADNGDDSRELGKDESVQRLGARTAKRNMEQHEDSQA